MAEAQCPGDLRGREERASSRRFPQIPLPPGSQLLCSLTILLSWCCDIFRDIEEDYLTRSKINPRLWGSFACCKTEHQKASFLNSCSGRASLPLASPSCSCLMPSSIMARSITRLAESSARHSKSSVLKVFIYSGKEVGFLKSTKAKEISVS